MAARAAPGLAQTAKIAAKVVENPLKTGKNPKNTNKTVEMADLPLTRSGERPHGDPR
jgi:hypothetical protein